MNARHVRPKGQPRGAWAPLDPDFDRTLAIPEPKPNPLSGMEVMAVRNQFADDLWIHTRKALGVSQALKHLAPRRTPARGVARGVRRLVGLGLYTVSVLVAIAVAPVLYAVGV